jgi:polysaccharide export outer membrane protein
MGRFGPATRRDQGEDDQGEDGAMMVAKDIRRTGWRCAAALALAVPALAGCQHAPAASVSRSAAEPMASTPYLIGPGDQLSVFVYQSPQLSVPNLAVRPDGRISLPLIPDIAAAGKTPTVLAKDIEGRLKEYVKEPNVSVIVSGFVGPLDRQIRVIGEATEPLAIPYRDKMTVLDVMIQTKGLTRYAAGNSSVIVREVGGKRETLKVRLSDLLRDGDIDQNVAMLPGDTLIIPQSWF